MYFSSRGQLAGGAMDDGINYFPLVVEGGLQSHQLYFGGDGVIRIAEFEANFVFWCARSSSRYWLVIGKSKVAGHGQGKPGQLRLPKMVIDSLSECSPKFLQEIAILDG